MRPPAQSGSSGTASASSSSMPNAVSLRHMLLAAMSRSDFARAAYQKFSGVPVLGPVVRSALGRLLPSEGRVWVQIPEGLGEGLWLRASARFEPHFLDGRYELWAQRVLLQHLLPGSCFYDVGAHVGFFSLLAARLVGETGQVVAFEPDPENAEVLRAAARRNRVPQIRVVEAAVWSSSGPIEFQPADPASSRMDGQVGPIANWNNGRIRVTGLALDDFVLGRKARSPDFLKIDVEAAESEVLKGASKLFETCCPFVLCEIHNALNKAGVQDWLAQRGYQLRWLEGRGPYPVQLVGESNGSFSD